MKFFRRKSTAPASRLFLHGEDSAIAHVREYADGVVFDEWVAASQHVGTGKPPQFLGVSVKSTRLRAAAIFFTAVVLLFISKAAHLQIMNGREYRALAEGNRVRVELVPSLRGIIYDRNQRILAENTSSFRLIGVANDLPTDEARVVLFERVSEVTGTPVPEILSHAADGEDHPDEPMVLVKDLPYDVALSFMLKEKDFPGIQVEASTERSYITTAIPTLSHVLGYTGRINQEEYAALRPSGYRLIDDLGKLGVEQVYEKELRGTYGREVKEVDAFGHELNIITKENAVDGENLVLSIDANLTAKIEQVLEDNIGTAGRASVVVTDPNNGEVFALVSTPSFDANDFTGGIDAGTYQSLLDDPNHPLFNRAIAGALPPGSTFKLIVAAGALAEGIIDRTTSFVSVGGLQVGPYFFKDWKAGGHGVTNVTRALAESINTFFYYIGGGYGGFTGLGVEKIASYAEHFGFGNTLGIDLPGEGSGFLPNKRWKEEAKGERWYIGDTYNMAIGQGDVLVTPLQIAMLTSTIANGGTLYQPHVAHAFIDSAGTHVNEPTILNAQVVDKQAIEIVREGLRQTVTSGSGRSLLGLPVTAAGKTGTAQWSNTHKTHAWFTAFAPYEHPEVTITVVVEEGGGGDVIAVPIAKEILEWWFTQYNIDATAEGQDVLP